jgi:ribosomal protein S4
VLKLGDGLGLTTRGRKSEYFQTVAENISSKQVPTWLEMDPAQLTGKIVSAPEVEEIGAKFNPATIVEYYSR